MLLLVFISMLFAQTVSAEEFAYSKKVDALVAELEADGFIVQESGYQMIDILKLCSEGWFEYCFGNNAGFPYLCYTMPPAPGQKPSRGQNPPVGFDPKDPNNYPANLDFTPPGTTFKLRPDEAILLVGKTPPQARYFSYRSYVGFVENKPGKDYSDIFVVNSADGAAYHRVFASLGDPLNHLSPNTSGTPDHSAGNAFDKEIVLITTPHQGVNQRVRQAIKKSGISESIVNDDIIPASLVNLGLEDGKDTFLVITRAALWENNEQGQAFLNDPTKTCRVFRITPKEELAADPYPVPKLKQRGNGISEFKILPTAKDDLETLREAILKKHGLPQYKTRELHTDIWLPEGFIGICDDLDILAEDRDTVYLQSEDFQLKSDDDFIIVYGVNHEKTGKAIYCNLSFYGKELINGVAGSNSSLFTGSAREYFPAGYENADNYYVVKLARKGDDCVIVEKSTDNPRGKAYGVDNNKDSYIITRSYIEKPNQVGPAHYELIYDRTILFTKK